MSEFLHTFGIFIGITAVISAPIVVIADTGSRYKCSNYEKTTGKETKYLTLDSCYVKTQAGWQRWDEYTARSIASEGLSN